MNRIIRLVLFGAVAVTAWCMASDSVLSRVATDEPAEDAAAPGSGHTSAATETDYQVVRLLSKLFTSIKRTYVEVLGLHKQLSRSTDRNEQAEVRAMLEDRIGFVEEKGREYSRLVPGLVESYPTLKSVIHSFSKDLAAITSDLDRLKRTDGLTVAPAPAVSEGLDSSGASSSAPGAGTGGPGQGRATPAGTRSPLDPLILPITLEIRGTGGEKVPQRRVTFVVERGRSRGIRGILDGRSLVNEKVAFTDGSGKASVQLQLEDSRSNLRIKRTIVPMIDQTVCRLETVTVAGPTR